LLAYSVGRVLYNTQPEDYNPTKHPEHDNAGRHVADWLAAAIANREPWLANVDYLGRPKKLLKFPTLEAITQEADKAMLRYAQQNRDVKLREGDEELVMEMEGGFYVVRLMTSEALDRESGEMQHCIGNGAYDARLHDPGLLYLSLRDGSGKAHATVEVLDGCVLQLQGKQNRQPNREYLEALAPLFRREGYVISDDRTDLRFVYVDDYRVVDAWDLSGCTEIIGDLTRTKATLRMPKKLRVRGSVHISASSFPDGFPREIEADGPITIIECRGFVAPSRIVTGGDLTITGTALDGDIDYCEARGSVSFKRSPIERLPLEIKFDGSLDLRQSGITSLDGLTHVGGYLDVASTLIERLPPGIRVGGKLDASSSRLKEYPSEAKLDGAVDISNTQVSVLPVVDVQGRLNISCTKITEIPEGLAAWSLEATGLSLEKFGPKSIPRDLDLAYSKVRLPDGLTVGGFLTLDSADIGDLPANLTACKIKADSARITSIGRGLVVKGDLYICGNPIKTLPDDMDVWGDIYARQTLIASLPDGFACSGDLDLTSTSITALPYGLRVGHSLVLHDNNIAELPENLCVGVDLTITHTDVQAIPESAEIGRAVKSDVPDLHSGWSRYNEVKQWRASQASVAGPIL
jgi:hypothetical protein